MYDKKKKHFVVGHKSPDTDAIVSAIAYAAFLADTGHDVEPVALWNANSETTYVLKYAGMDMPTIVETFEDGAHLILVDHNEPGHSIYDKDKHHIKWVIDHHKFGWFSTSTPLHMMVEPLGSTATILAKLFKSKNYSPSPQLAMAMISAILSDTLHFRSPTTTEEDKLIVDELNKIANIQDLHHYSMEMFNAKSDLWDISAKDLVEIDYKLFEFGDLKAGIWVIETTNPNYSLSRKDEIIEVINSIKKTNWLDFVLLCVVDILNEQNTCIVAWDMEEQVVQRAFGAKTVNGLADLGNRVSRKLQIVPEIAVALG